MIIYGKKCAGLVVNMLDVHVGALVRVTAHVLLLNKTLLLHCHVQPQVYE